MNPVPIAPTLNDATDLTVAVTLSGPVELRPGPVPSAPSPDGHAYRQRIRAFIESRYLSRTPSASARGIFDIALEYMEAMQSTVRRHEPAEYRPDVTVKIPRNACGFHEFWRAEELIALGRKFTAQAFAASGRGPARESS